MTKTKLLKHYLTQDDENLAMLIRGQKNSSPSNAVHFAEKCLFLRHVLPGRIFWHMIQTQAPIPNCQFLRWPNSTALTLQYDLSTSTFSPDGRIFQTDYAAKAVSSRG